MNKTKHFEALYAVRISTLHLFFYRATRIHSADYAVARSVRLFVHLSICPSHAGIVCKRLYISSKYFIVG